MAKKKEKHPKYDHNLAKLEKAKDAKASKTEIDALEKILVYMDRIGGGDLRNDTIALLVSAK